MRVHCVQHSDKVQPFGVLDWAESRGIDLVTVRADKRELPDPSTVERVIVLGGEMDTRDTADHPWLVDEKSWLDSVTANPDVYVFGICLGAQLLAEGNGGRVVAADDPEVGWHDVNTTNAGETSSVAAALAGTAFEWHYDSIRFPDDASVTVTLSSEATPVQGFCIGDRINAVQFHPEFTLSCVTKLAESTTEDLTPRGLIQHPDQFLAEHDNFDSLIERRNRALDAAMGLEERTR